MKEYFLPRKTLKLWRIRLVACFVPFFAAALLSGSVYISAAAVFLLAAFLFLYLFYLPRAHRVYKIEFGEGYMALFGGVFIKTEKILPSKRIIAVRLASGPLTRRLRLAGISVSAVHFRLRLAPMDLGSAKILTEALGGDTDEGI